MSNPDVGSAAFVLHIDWDNGDDDDPTDFKLSEVAAVQQLISERELWPEAFSSDCPDIVDILDHLAPLAHPDLDQIEVNGVTVVVAGRVRSSRRSAVPSVVVAHVAVTHGVHPVDRRQFEFAG